MNALYGVIAGVGRGELTPEEGQTVAHLLEQGRKAQELIELETRMQKMEKHYWGGGQSERQGN